MTDLVKQSNPFGDNGNGAVTIPQAGSGAMVDVEGQRAVAETQAAMAIAKRFPRDQIMAMDRIINSCTRPTLAEQALYQYARGGTNITGPSIRMAEALAIGWGNIDFGVKELEQRNGESTVMAYAHDLETNTRQVKIFQVAHKRHTRKGSYKLEDPRDIYEMVANQGARRLRACILGIIPGDVVEAAQKQCEATLQTKAEVTPERLKDLVEKFAEYSVTKDMIEAKIQRRIDAITPALMVQLGKIFNSLKDGMSVPADWFEVAPGPEGGSEKKSATDALKDKLNEKTTGQTSGSTPEQVDKAIKTIDPGGNAYQGPWEKNNWFNSRAGDGAKTGFVRFVRDNAATFSEAPEGIQIEAKVKWAKIYPGKTWPLDPPQEEKEPENSTQSTTGEDSGSQGMDDPAQQQHLEAYKEVIMEITSSRDIHRWVATNGLAVEEKIFGDYLGQLNRFVSERIKEVKEIEEAEQAEGGPE